MNTLEEAIEIYQAEKAAFQAWYKETSGQYAISGGNIFGWGGSDYQRAVKWDAEISAMAKVLGIEPEVKQ